MFKNPDKRHHDRLQSIQLPVCKVLPVLSKGFEIETEMSIHAVDKNMYIENEVIEYRDRPEGRIQTEYIFRWLPGTCRKP